MTASHLDDAFERWPNALLDALATPGNVMAWQDRRYQFAYQVRQLLVDTGGPGIPVSDHAVYGVYVTGGGLLYVGQTRDARRRLRDPPAGESHHLATTVPPETWDRILVIQWPALITRIPAQEAQRTKQLGPASCGLGGAASNQPPCRDGDLLFRRIGQCDVRASRETRRARRRSAGVSLCRRD